MEKKLKESLFIRSRDVKKYKNAEIIAYLASVLIMLMLNVKFLSVMYIILLGTVLYYETLSGLGKYSKSTIMKNELLHLCFGGSYFLPYAYLLTVISVMPQGGRARSLSLGIIIATFWVTIIVLGWVFTVYWKVYFQNKIRK